MSKDPTSRPRFVSRDPALLAQQRCHAVVGGGAQYQAEWAQLCQNRPISLINGIPLCGTHVNRSYTHPHPLKVLTTLEYNP